MKISYRSIDFLPKIRYNLCRKLIVRIRDQHIPFSRDVLFFTQKEKVMEFYKKLPRNKKEFALFLAIISIISVNIIAPVITCFEIGFHLKVWGNAMKAVPFIWLTVIALVLLTYKPTEYATAKFVGKDDSFNSHILANILFTVLMMSVVLTVVGTWIGSRHISMEPITHFFYKWPRNFSISFFVEGCIAQPIARFVMLKLHNLQDSRQNS